jgi:transcriptional regulator
MAKRNLMPGTLDLMVLQTVLAGGPQHGYGIARFIEKTSGNELKLNQGTIYDSLIRLKKRGWIRSQWGTSENNRKAKFYEITKPGGRQLFAATRQWEWLSNLMDRVLGLGKVSSAR